MTSCLRQFSASEMLCARNKFFCDTCSSLQEAEKRMKVKKLPNVLALHLKRFKYEEAVQKFVKLAYRVVFPFQMRLFNTSDDAEDPDKLYELFAIIVHLGMGPHQGHYISIVRVGIRWFVLDDETVTIIDEADISRYFGDTPGAGSAYVLFYQAVELNMEELGLVDTAAERQKARQKMEEEAWVQYRMGHSPTLEMSSLKEVPPRLLSTSPAPLQGSVSPNEAPIYDGRMPPTPSTPQSAQARKQNTLSSLSSQNSNDLAESKSTSWFSSLRPGSGRKASSNNFLSVASQGGSAGLPIPFKPHAGHAEDVDTASISTSSSSRHANKDVLTASGSSADNSLPIKGLPGASMNGESASPEHTSHNLFASPSKMVKQPSQGAGAAFAPAGRSLSKKEQELIAKKSRRSSLTMAHGHALPLPLSNGHLAYQGVAPSAEVAALPAVIEGKKPLIRRPSTADPPAATTTTSPRRKTISRTFGFGRKADKG